MSFENLPLNAPLLVGVEDFDSLKAHLDNCELLFLQDTHYRSPSSPKKTGVTCRCCKTQNLTWTDSKGKWRLFDDKGLHNCEVNPLVE